MLEQIESALCAAAAGSPVLVLAAHIDDEVIGLGSHLARWPNVLVLHATDSSPRNLEDARRCGFSTRGQYAAARRSELLKALDVLGASHVRLAQLDIADQEAACNIHRIARELQSWIDTWKPVLVLTHPYEGGHPDHDACACALAHTAGAVRAEFTSYHAHGEGTRTARFLSQTPEHVHVLSSPEHERKVRAFACFGTQRETLSIFTADVERLRPQPRYDFTQPPHAGHLNYECHPWGMTGARFRALARPAHELTVLNVAYPLAPVSPDTAGGAEQVLANLDRALVQRGHRSLVIARQDSRVAGDLIPLPGPAATLDAAAVRTAHQRTRAALQHTLANHHIDLVHMHGIDFHNYLPEAGVPVLATLHLPPEWYPSEVFASARPRTFLHCVSRSQQRRCPSAPHLLPPIENGVDPALFNAAAPKHDYALALGRICPEKGFHLALRAARAAGVRVILAGEVFPYPEHVRYFQKEIEPLLDERRVWIGLAGLDRKRELLAHARCLLVPSLVAETSSLVAMEALASGTPVIAYPNGALSEIVEEGVTGFLVNDVDAMAAAIGNAGRISPETCRRHAEERFRLDRTIDRYLETYGAIAAA